ncbi:MAG TPA: marine proteobacterial sortase target protein [Candidatus Acidoferrum sp.]|nr:marine proteobacterial sortase target protein [Candidatus Acidoferrum sp.]
MSLLAKQSRKNTPAAAVPGLPIDWIPITWLPIALALLVLTTVFASSAKPAQADGSSAPAQASDAVPPVGEGCLIYRSAASSEYEALPLAHTDVALDVRGLVVAATVTQQYVNSAQEPLEAVYVFPLPHDAAVYDMEIRVGNRVIRSVIREREEAKRVYNAAKSAGQRAALVEEERPNIFTTSVANIMPGDHIEVRLRYVEPLRWEDGKVRLTFPMTVGPRYIPGAQAVGHSGTGWALDTDAVSDASRITPPVRNPVSSRSGHDLSLAVDLDPGFALGSVKSISHTIAVKRLGDGRQHITLADGPTIPNKDFILEVEAAASTQPETALFLSPDTESGETNFLLATFPPSVAPSEQGPVEMLYLIDVSGSMEGTSITQARAALLQALDRLRPNDRFGILAFNHLYHEFSPAPLLATTDNVTAARQFVENLQAGGGTEMLPALRHVMQKPQIPGYLRHIILLTDGDLGNEEQIFAALNSNLGGARLYTVAIGSAPNFFLATKMAQFGRGTFTHIASVTEITEQMGHLLNSIESPVLTDVNLSFEGVQVADLYPERPPDLFLRQPLLIYGRITEGQKGRVILTAHAGNQPYQASFPIDATTATFHPGITVLWARQRVEHFMDQWRQTEEGARDAIRAAIVAHAIRYRLVTRFTSLVAVEQLVSNPGGESSTVAVRSELPEGMQMDKVFGAPATGTADAFLEALGLALIGISLAVIWGLRFLRISHNDGAFQ